MASQEGDAVPGGRVTTSDVERRRECRQRLLAMEGGLMIAGNLLEGVEPFGIGASQVKRLLV